MSEELIRRYFPGLSEEQLARYARMEALYRAWNEKINVISRKDIDALALHHTLHSLAIAKVIRFKPGTRVLDAGTGGGFPGIPLAIFFPDVDFLLVDSVGKKVRVVEEIVSALGLTNARALQRRVEEVEERFDFVVSRAVTTFPLFVSWTRKKIRGGDFNALPNGILYLKGGDFQEEVRGFRRELTLYPVSDYFDDPYFEAKSVLYLPR
ncbi:MAG: 16S rRNA (guanine(527)-N(7))-methyltransferase RsmG [Odoribacteraceae bacterium]|jgi:16S rRNA (guanine527-N7)-methyltransferase|nr:16S rRNA (guanine(527)-N(7))-methyltransferase RsmG [Odoribacteraceae bacterium]